ncbi:MAG: NAD(P)-binding domain-containing protein, partial [Bacteroidetes bacterium]|nr:NAD(P)-binding domain-containing protein [Bacteroidota bacterium]
FAAGLRALELGLRYIILEQNDIGGTVLQYPRAKVVLTSPVELPLWGKVKLMETRKEALLELWTKVMQKTGLRVQTGEKVTGIVKANDQFIITSAGMEVKARYVVLALGRRGTPRKLGVEGEGLSKVSYRLIDAASFTGKHLLVVGGGDSAIEAAIGLASQQGNTVTLSYRKEEFTRIKERNRQYIEDFNRRKKVRVLFNSEVTAIRGNEVAFSTTTGPVILPNDYVFIFAGGELPYPFLKSIGVGMHHHVVE